MWTLPAPEVADVEDQLRRALTLESGEPVYSLSAAEWDAVRELYDRYDELCGQPDPLLNPGALHAARHAIYDAYGQVQKRGRLRQLRGELLADLLECPLCGFGEPRTLDHYLPRSEYQSLAIYPKNLIPSCQACNRAKGIEVPGEDPGFIHAYFQALPDQGFLRAGIEYAAPTLVVTFRIEGVGIPPNLLARLRHQLTRLDLNVRYGPRINTLLFELKPSILAFLVQAASADLIQQFFTQSAAYYVNDFGLNHWRTAFMRGLAQSPEFCANPQPYLTTPATIVAGAG